MQNECNFIFYIIRWLPGTATQTNNVQFIKTTFEHYPRWGGCPQATSNIHQW